VALTRNRIAALLGEGPDRGLTIARPDAARLRAFGLPADVRVALVGRRPDLTAARLRAEAAGDKIKAAKADFYPNIQLSAYFGLQSLGLGAFGKSGSDIGGVGPAVTLPIFDGGRLRAAYGVAGADYDAAVADYDATLIRALREVADAAASSHSLTERLGESRKALEASREAHDIALQRYRGGLSNYLDVLTAEDALIADQRAVADLQARAFLLDIALTRALAVGGWTLVEGGKHVKTDNAYVDATAAQVTPLTAAAVTSVPVINTQVVKVGDPLVVLDDADARLALARAEADLAQTQHRVVGYHANEDALGAEIAARAAQVQSARANLERARTDYDRRKGLEANGAISGEELTQARNALDTAQAGVAAAIAQQRAAEGQRAVNSALISGAGENPEVAAARVRVEQARLDLARTTIRAPIAGVVAKNDVQIGQRVQVGQPLMSIVPVDQAYVNANFKEQQLRKVRVGQPVELTSDLYGGAVKYHGSVVGVSSGTGSAFALIPAQNATGNWIKVVQRLPVRVAIDAPDLRAHPLRVGMSMNAQITTGR
jgi:membrane fusion protein (multidrug efflux system)